MISSVTRACIASPQDFMTPPPPRRPNIHPFISVLGTPQGFPLIIKRNNDKTHLIIVRSEYYLHICGLDLIPLNWSTHNTVPQTNPTFRFFGCSPTCRVTDRKSNDRSRFNFAQSEYPQSRITNKSTFQFFQWFPSFSTKNNYYYRIQGPILSILKKPFLTCRVVRRRSRVLGLPQNQEHFLNPCPYTVEPQLTGAY